MTAVQARRPAATAAEPAVAPPPGSPRFPLVDGLRAVAAISVLVYHAAHLSGATDASYGAVVGRLEIGVAVFFAISGFLLYRPFVAALYDGRPAPRARDYLRRRFLRIVPAYWLALTVLAITPGLPGVFTGDWWIYYGFGQIYRSDTFFSGLDVAWTLSIEVAFYLFLPFYALAMRRLCRDRDARWIVRAELAVLAAVAVASLTYRTIASANGQGVYYAWLPGWLDWFAPGMALAVISVALERRERPWAPAALVARHPQIVWMLAAAFFAVLALTVPPPGDDAIWYTPGEMFRAHVLSAIVALLLLIPAVVGPERGGRLRALLSLRSVAWLGLISYGIYLWHHPIMVWLAGHGAIDWIPRTGFVTLTLSTAAVAVVCAAVSYYVVERPLLRLKDPRRTRRAG